THDECRSCEERPTHPVAVRPPRPTPPPRPAPRDDNGRQDNLPFVPARSLGRRSGPDATPSIAVPGRFAAAPALPVAARGRGDARTSKKQEAAGAGLAAA